MYVAWIYKAGAQTIADDIRLSFVCVKAEQCVLMNPNRPIADTIKGHDFFAGVDFDAVDQKRIKPPTDPKVLPPGDCSCFDEYGPRVDKYEDVDSSKVGFPGF